jgi:ferredoxin
MTRVRVDPGVCQGYAKCNSLLPEVFEIGDDGISRVLVPEVPPELLGQVSEVADWCPTGAISLVDADGGD